MMMFTVAEMKNSPFTSSQKTTMFLENVNFIQRNRNQSANFNFISTSVDETWDSFHLIAKQETSEWRCRRNLSNGVVYFNFYISHSKALDSKMELFLLLNWNRIGMECDRMESSLWHILGICIFESDFQSPNRTQFSASQQFKKSFPHTRRQIDFARELLTSSRSFSSLTHISTVVKGCYPHNRIIENEEWFLFPCNSLFLHLPSHSKVDSSLKLMMLMADLRNGERKKVDNKVPHSNENLCVWVREA